MTLIDPSDPASAAFLGLRLRAVEHLLNAQGKALSSTLGVKTPHVCVSLLCLIAVRQPAPVSELTTALGLSRQLVLQRLKLLEDQKLITSRTDAADRRSRLIRLSKIGEAEHRNLQTLMPKLETAFRELNEEVGADLSAILRAAEEALKHRGLIERVINADALPAAAGGAKSRQKPTRRASGAGPA